MMMETWERIAYIVQLIGACLVFMAPAKKRAYYLGRIGVSSILLIIASYVINGAYTVQTFGPFYFLYWICYIGACVLFVWSGLSCSLLEALYCAVCACAMQHVAFDGYLIYQVLGGSNEFVYFIIYAVIYASFYYFLAKLLPEHGGFAVSKRAVFPMATIIILVWVLSILEVSGQPGFGAEPGVRIILRIIDALCCFYVLWVQVYQKEKTSLQRELDGINYAWRQQIQQYNVTKDTIDSINRKCHDLKHQIRALRHMTDEQEKEEFFDELEQDIMIYDTALNTGNKALDTVLMEKGLFCKNHNIQWSCMADGSKLGFMKLEDIYAIFGNALDNAIAAVMELPEEQKRVISVKIINQKNILMIQVQNYYDRALHFEDGLPVTTKHNWKNHGFGMKSIRYTAEKYNGTITVNAENHIFMLQILIPVA